MDDLMMEAYTYYIGDGYTFDRVKALEIYTKLAEEGNVDAMYYCGLCLDYLGKRNKDNYIKADIYFKKAASLNHKGAIDYLKKKEED